VFARVREGLKHKRLVRVSGTRGRIAEAKRGLGPVIVSIIGILLILVVTLALAVAYPSLFGPYIFGALVTEVVIAPALGHFVSAVCRALTED